MIKLYGFGRCLGLADPSPFVLKVMTYMRMAGIEYKPLSSSSNLSRAPKGKLPYIDDEGEVVADSFFIVKFLKRKYGVDLDAHLSPEQAAISHLITKSLDENLYWCIIYSRWLDEETWLEVKQRFFGSMPFPLRIIVPFVVRRGVRSAFLRHGMGRHSDEEILEIAKESLESLSQLLGDKRYFFGDNPSGLDASVYGFVAQLVLVDLDNPMNRLAKSYGNLVEFCNRLDSQYYP
jgi:glutathione S-transferase